MDETTDPFADFLASLDGFWVTAIAFMEGILTPGWRQNQVLIVLALAVEQSTLGSDRKSNV